MLLALDTATDYASVALYDGRQVLAEFNWRSQRRHTVELAAQVDALFALAEGQVSDLQALAVAVGPGSYTGTRIAVSYAKGIVAALALPLVGIPTLDALAYPHLQADTPLCVLVEAGRKRYCWAVYAPGGDTPKRTSQWGLATLPEIAATISTPTRFAGELRPDDVLFLHQSRGESVVIIPQALCVRRAGALAALAWQRWQGGDIADPATLSPIYLS